MMSPTTAAPKIRVLGLSLRREGAAQLRSSLFVCGEIELVGIALDVDETVRRAAADRPDLVLVALGQGTDYRALADGLWSMGGVPVAGVEHSALRAGEVEQLAVARITSLATPLSFDALKQMTLAEEHRSIAVRSDSGDGQLALHSKGRVRLVRHSEIVWLEAVRNSVQLHLLHQRGSIRRSLAAVLRHLPPERFLRIHRSYVLNLDHVRDFRISMRGKYSAILPNGTVLSVGRTFHKDVVRRLKLLRVSPC